MVSLIEFPFVSYFSNIETEKMRLVTWKDKILLQMVIQRSMKCAALNRSFHHPMLLRESK